MFVVTDLSSYRLSLSSFILSFSLLFSCLAVPLLQVSLLFQPDDYISRFTRESSFSVATFPLRHLHLPSTFSLHISKAFFFFSGTVRRFRLTLIQSVTFQDTSELRGKRLFDIFFGFLELPI